MEINDRILDRLTKGLLADGPGLLTLHRLLCRRHSQQSHEFLSCQICLLASELAIFRQ